MQRHNIKNLSFILLLLVVIVNVTWHVYAYRGDIFKKFDSAYWTKRYQESQWVVPNSKNSIGDDGLYIYAGYRYMQGDDPSLLNAEIPPFGKYLIGFFETTTGYIGTFSLFFGVLSLVLFYFFNKIIFRSSFLALLPVAIFSFDPLFFSQLRAPYLDTLYLCFLLLGFTLFLRKKYLLAGLSFGAFMAIKSPFLIFIVYAVIFLYLFLQKSFRLTTLLKMILATIIIFMTSYAATYLHGHGLIYFLKTQKYIVHFYAIGAKGIFGAVFPMMLFNTWYTWYNTVQSVAEWTLLWPIALLGGVVGIIIWLRRKTNFMIFHILWIGLYFIFLSITPIFARYLLLLLPFLYNLCIWSLSAVTEKKS